MRTSTVYLLCLDSPLGHARHYVGSALHLERRLAYHETGSGANFLRVCRERGITWTLVRTKPGGKAEERRIKRAGGQVRYCPRCNPRCGSRVWGSEATTVWRE